VITALSERRRMSVMTTDILVEGKRRDDVLAWLADPAHHDQLVEGAFDGVKRNGPGDYVLTLRVAPKAREMTYRFSRVDEDHGGRRVHVELGGRRTTGKLHYSLRTTKPSTNTMVTLHVDLDGHGILDRLVQAAGLRERLEEGLRKMLENLQRAVAAV
jgi:carbon monoxide dehydrogenase subunit G